MKKILFPVIAVVVMFASCDKIKKLGNVTFNVPLSGTAAVPSHDSLPSIPTGGIYKDISTPKVATTASQQFSTYNTNASLLQSVKMTALSANLVNPPATSSHFNFADTIRIYMNATGQSEILVAYKYGSSSADSMTFTTVDQDLKPYFIADSISMRVNAHFISLPDSSGTVQLNTNFQIVANPIN